MTWARNLRGHTHTHTHTHVDTHTHTRTQAHAHTQTHPHTNTYTRNGFPSWPRSIVLDTKDVTIVEKSYFAGARRICWEAR